MLWHIHVPTKWMAELMYMWLHQIVMLSYLSYNYLLKKAIIRRVLLYDFDKCAILLISEKFRRDKC